METLKDSKNGSLYTAYIYFLMCTLMSTCYMSMYHVIADAFRLEGIGSPETEYSCIENHHIGCWE